MKYDDILTLLGEFGRFQKIQCLLVCLVTLTLSFHSMNMVFVGPTPEHKCRPDLNSSDLGNLSDTQLQLVLYPFRSDGSQDGCHIHNISERIGNDNISEWSYYNVTKIYCQNGWIYSKQYYTNTIVSEWDLVCNEAWKRSTASSIFFAGRLTGALVAGQLSDIIGRRPVFIVGSILLAAVGTGAAFSPNVELFYVLYFLQGLLQVSVSLTSFVLGVELLGTSKRTFYVLVNKFSDCLGQISLTPIAYLIRDWRWIEFTISIVFVIYISYIWFLPESVRWLMSKGKEKEARTILRRAAKINKAHLPESVLEKIEVEDPKKSNYTVLDLFRRWKFAKITLILWYLWLANAMVYYGLTINTSDMGVDPYVNYFLSCTAEIPALIIAMALLDRIGRRKMLFAFTMTGALGCITTAFVPPHRKWVSTALSILGKFGISGSYCMMYLMSAEIFPTVVRNVGIGTSSMWARIGGMLAPALIFFSNYYKPLPLLAFGAITFLAAGLGLLLPELAGKPLAQNFDDLEEQQNESKQKDEKFSETSRNRESKNTNNAYNLESEKNLLADQVEKTEADNGKLNCDETNIA